MTHGFSTQRAAVTEGLGAPNITPSYIGQEYYDLSTGSIYKAMGTNGKWNWAFLGRGSLSSFTKDTVSGLVGWFDTSDLTTVTKDSSDLVTVWYDKSGTNRNLNSVSATKPVWYENSINNLPGIFFGGSSFIYGTSLSAINSSYQTLYVVVRPTAWSTGTYQNIITEATASTTTFGLLKDTGNTNIYTYSYNVSQANSGSLTSSNNYIVGVKYNGSSGWCSVNGSRTNITTGTTGSNDTTTLYVACNISGTQIYTGYVSEILIFNTILSDSDDTIVQTYLNNKWGIY